MEAAAASFRTVMVSTSLGLILFKSPSYGKLSSTIKGAAWLFTASKVLLPLILMRSSPEFFPKSTPGVTPYNRSRILEDTLLLTNSLSNTAKEPVALSRGID